MVKRKVRKEAPVEVVRMSELPEKRQKKTKVVIMDKHIKRKVKSGEELKLEEIANE